LCELLQLFVGDAGNKAVAKVGDEISFQHDLVVTPAGLAHARRQLPVHLRNHQPCHICEPLADHGQAVFLAHLIFHIQLTGTAFGIIQLTALGCDTQPASINLESSLPCSAVLALYETHITVKQRHSLIGKLGHAVSWDRVLPQDIAELAIGRAVTVATKSTIQEQLRTITALAHASLQFELPLHHKTNAPPPPHQSEPGYTLPKMAYGRYDHRRGLCYL
jgi:hypothetical protein